MIDRPIDVFFYGLFMDEDLLSAKGIIAVNDAYASKLRAVIKKLGFPSEYIERVG
jgi:hypothetical protein